MGHALSAGNDRAGVGSGAAPADPADVPRDPWAADRRGDGVIEAFDLAMLLASWGSCDDCAADINSDGIVNAFDLAIPLGSWGPCE